ncbi:CHC2 zinc finger domain-containing protein [Acetivibrio thermocellus]|uniref:CHC2 zinc finger domain-containing protein n=1 Tax=Acetivibrio thermocellus TaxID=1515 RepID=UPI0010A5AA5A|nr:CHC2 zinc finger domain-containing protein [Acetivibrio thermocellus]THJ78605.1 hypothetical protein EPD62_05125 [Acetivibrio thermocellus]
MMDTKTFLEAFHQNNKINFRALRAGQKPLNLNGYYNQTMKDKLKQLNEQGYNIYFTVNSGGTKKEQINKINAFFIDCDCGRDNNGNYFDLNTVKEYKEKVLQRVQEFGLAPSFIVDTRNGYHVYWLVNNANVEEFQEVQNKLIHYFNSDERVYTPERIMRVPNYFWTKTGYNKYMCKIIQANNVRYDIQDIINALPGLPEENGEKRVHNNRYNYNNIYYCVRKNPLEDINYNILAIKNLDVKMMRKFVNTNIESYRGFLADYKTKVYNTLVYQSAKNLYIAQNRNEVYKIIDSIDLADFLGIENPNSFKCIIHDDHNPSANIYKTDDGTDIYKCFGCGFTGGIIKIVEKIADCSKIDAINFIKSVYNIELIQSQWQKEQIEILETNKDYLLSGKMEIEYPQLWKYVKPRLSKLLAFIDIAIRNVYDEELSYNGMPVFYASLTQLQNVFETNSRDTVNKNINLFCLLHLIQKVQLDCIPKNMLLKAIEWAKKKRFNKIPNHYQMPAYDNKTLEQAELNAKILQDNNFTMKGISREWVIRTFGEEVANKIYPQCKKENAKGTTKASDERTIQIAKIIMQEIDKKGYCTEQQVIEQLKHKYGKTLTQIQLKRSLQQILESYNLKRVRANKELKEQYGIASKGYPFLILRETEE